MRGQSGEQASGSPVAAGGAGAHPSAEMSVAPLSEREWRIMTAAWLVALAATLGALFVGEVMGKTPCVLCWYQRIAMFPLAIILGIGALTSDARAIRYALPLALAGLAVATWHSAVFAGIAPQEIQPCTRTGPSCSGDAMKLGPVPLPFLALAAFAMIAALLVTARRRMT